MDSLTQFDNNEITKSLCYELDIEKGIEKVEEQRTKIKKKLFLESFATTQGVVSACCEKTGISRQTYYNWKDEDEDFANELQKIEDMKNDVAKDLAWWHIIARKDTGMLRHWLDRKHPEFKPTSKTELVAGDRTLEDLLDEDEKKIKQINADKQGIDRKLIEDTQQAGDSSAIQVECSPTVLLAEEDAPKPDTQSASEGTD